MFNELHIKKLVFIQIIIFILSTLLSFMYIILPAGVHGKAVKKLSL